MVAIPEQPQGATQHALDQLQQWYEQQQQLARVKVTEVLLRKEVAHSFFPAPREGTNNYALEGGYQLVMVHSINRKPDEAALHNISHEDMRVIESMAIPMADLFKQSWSLSLTAYNSLTDEQRAFVDKLLDIKPSDTPKLSVVAPKDDKAPAPAPAPAPWEETAPAPNAPNAPDTAAVSNGTAAPTFDINTGRESSTKNGQYYRDKSGVWWLLQDDEWTEIVGDATLAALDAQLAATKSKPTAPAKSKRAKAGVA